MHRHLQYESSAELRDYRYGLCADNPEPNQFVLDRVAAIDAILDAREQAEANRLGHEAVAAELKRHTVPAWEVRGHPLANVDGARVVAYEVNRRAELAEPDATPDEARHLQAMSSAELRDYRHELDKT